MWSLQAAHEDTAGPCRLHLVWSASDEAQEYWSSSQEIPRSALTNLLLCWHWDLPMSTKWQTVYFLCRSMMVDRRFQEFHLALLGISLFEHLGQATMEYLNAWAVLSQSVGGHDRSLNFSL